MSVELIHLRKLLQIMYAGPRQQRSLVRGEIRSDQARANGTQGSGGDFYGPFWADVKEHVTGRTDLSEATKLRMERNSTRERLYPVLRDGFLTWWNEHRRWTNEPFEAVRSPSTIFRVNDFLKIKIENILTVRDAHGVDRYIYPYFYESPTVRNEAARVALWVMKNAFRALSFENFRLLDIPRGRIFSPDRCYLEGDEAALLASKHKEVWNLYVEMEEGAR